jgi:transcriptional regulator with XRE-family HTH domain
VATPAGTLIREARHAAGLSQRELAARSGVAAQTLSAYENGARDPGSTTLAKVLRAAGQDLASTPVRSEQSRHVELVMELADGLPQRLMPTMGFPPFRTLIRT